MALALYLDHHVPRAVALGLRLRSVDVLTAYEDEAHELSDPKLLDRVQALGRVLVSQDDDLLREAARRQQASETFTGVIFTRQLQFSIGACIDDLEIISQAGEPGDLDNQILFLPL